MSTFAEEWGMNFERISELYRLFQFETKEKTDDCVVYVHDEGYFHNAEILVFGKNKANANRFLSDYSNLGYSARIVSYHNYQEAHDKLFAGFFKRDRTINKFLRLYQMFCNEQTSKLQSIDNDAKYSYTNGSYVLYGSEGEVKNDLITCIGNAMLDDNISAQLHILEAAAGMGKTSSSYELFSYLLNRCQGIKIPLIIELTKNRSARLFKYVLDDEINNSFPGLTRELVLNEIKLGNILLIIDGFDELLSKKEDNNEASGNAKTMLDTIAELFCGESHARIVLTSRKSTIFAGEQFEIWRDGLEDDVNVFRYEISSPTVKDWIGIDKLEVLRNKSIPLDKISNPVLLSMLKYMKTEELASIAAGRSIIDKYLSRLLEREISRQELELDYNEQFSIFTTLAKEFVSFEITAEEDTFIKDLFESIIGQNIDAYLSRYSLHEHKPIDSDEFLMKLVHHALLDRVSNQSNRIGYINEFIFGFFIGQALLNGELTQNSSELLNEKYLMLVSESFKMETKQNREKLFHIIEQIVSLFNIQQQLQVQLALCDRVYLKVDGAYIEAMVFDGIELTGEYKNVTFCDCSFRKCSIAFEHFQDCYFINCQFFDTDTTIARSNILFTNCIGAESVIIFENEPIEENSVTNYKRIILENFWVPGKQKGDSRRSSSAILRGTDPTERKSYLLAIDDLKKMGILSYKSGYYSLNHQKMKEIREILDI